MSESTVTESTDQIRQMYQSLVAKWTDDQIVDHILYWRAKSDEAMLKTHTDRHIEHLRRRIMALTKLRLATRNAAIEFRRGREFDRLVSDYVARAERDALKKAIERHYNQKADDRCWMDDDELYAAANLPPVDRAVGDKGAMLANCRRFIDNRCDGGKWKSYAELEDEIVALKNSLVNAEAACKAMRPCVEHLRAICRHKEIRPPMNPGVQEQFERDAEAALAKLEAVGLT